MIRGAISYFRVIGLVIMGRKQDSRKYLNILENLLRMINHVMEQERWISQYDNATIHQHV